MCLLGCSNDGYFQVLDPVKVAEQYRNTTKFKMDLIALLPLATVYKFITGRNGPLLAIPKTRLYNFDPLKPHFYIVKLGFTGVYIIFLISAQNIDCGYSLEPPHQGGSKVYQQSMF